MSVGDIFMDGVTSAVGGTSRNWHRTWGHKMAAEVVRSMNAAAREGQVCCRQDWGGAMVFMRQTLHYGRANKGDEVKRTTRRTKQCLVWLRVTLLSCLFATYFMASRPQPSLLLLQPVRLASSFFWASSLWLRLYLPASPTTASRASSLRPANLVHRRVHLLILGQLSECCDKSVLPPGFEPRNDLLCCQISLRAFFKQ